MMGNKVQMKNRKKNSRNQKKKEFLIQLDH